METYSNVKVGRPNNFYAIFPFRNTNCEMWEILDVGGVVCTSVGKPWIIIFIHKTSENFTYEFVPGQLHIQHTSLKTTKTGPSFRKINSPSTSTTLCRLLPAHLLVSELCPQTYSLSFPLEWSQVTHIPTSTTMGGIYKLERCLSTVPLPDNCVMTNLPGWLSAFPAHSQTFKPTPARFTHTNSQSSHSMS